MKNHTIKELYSSFLKRRVRIELIGRHHHGNQVHGGLLLLNDGQLAGSLSVRETLQKLHHSGLIHPLLVVAIHAGERQAEYGVAGTADYLGRGAKAMHYENFITRELMPWLNKNYSIHASEKSTAFAGFSLGGLSAFDIVTSNPSLFSTAGVFSGSLWWRSKSYDNGYTDNDRIVFNKIVNSRLKEHFKCYLMAGTNDERNDRNNNGVIDVVDDTLDMYELLHLKLKVPEKNLLLSIVNGGRHDPETWARQLPMFLVHAFGSHIDIH